MQQMTKREFLTALAGSLYAYSDLTDEMVERQLKQFERYFSRMSEEEAQTAIADFDSTEAIAANIYELIKDKERRQSVDTGVSTEPQARTRDYDHTASDFTVVNSRTAEAQPVTAASDATVQNTGEIEATRGGSLMESSDKAGGDTINLDRVKPGGPACDTDRYRREPADNGYDVSDGAGPGFEGAHLDFTSLDDEPHQNSPLFWVLFALTFPLWGTIIITVLALFLFAFAALAAMVVALIAVMIGVAAAGTGLSLFGIIYGITQTFDIFSAGLFEIGLGVTIGGGAMFVGIAVYNIAIRFLPFVMKELTVFLRFTLRLAKKLFLRLKKECASQ